MDSMEVNKGIAAVLVAGIVFFLTGLIGDNLVRRDAAGEAGAQHPGRAGRGDGQRRAGKAGGTAADRAAAGQGRRAGGRQAFAKRSAPPAIRSTRAASRCVGPNLYGVVGGPHDHEEGFNYSPALEKFKGQPWTFDDAEPLAGQAEPIRARHPHDLRGHPQRPAAGGRDRLSADAVGQSGGVAGAGSRAGPGTSGTASRCSGAGRRDACRAAARQVARAAGRAGTLRA